MSNVRKRNDDDAVDRPVPPYPAETSGTWQAFRVKVHEDDRGNGSETDKPPARPARSDADKN